MNREGNPTAILWGGIAVLLPALLVSLAPISTVDLGYGIRAGAMFLDGAGIQRVDTFTFTAAGLPWLNQQWLGQVLFAAVHRAGGWPGLATLWTVLVVAIQALLWLAARWSGAGARWAGMALLGGFLVAAQGIGLRAQVLGLLCLAALLAVVAARRQHPRSIWLAVPILAVWANLHGSFALGVALVGLVVAEDAAARKVRPAGAVAVFAACALATLLNPFGVDVWRYIAAIGTDSTISHFVTEWQHTSPLTPTGAVFYASVVALAILVVAAARGGARPSVATMAWLAGLALLGAWATRAIAFWGIGVTPAAAVLLTAVVGARSSADARGPADAPEAGPDPRHTPESDRKTGRAPRAATAISLAFVGVLALLVIVVQPIWAPTLDGEGLGPRLQDAPPGIAIAVGEAAEGRPGTRVFNVQRWGSWLELETPQVLLFADSRIELIPADAWADYVRVSEGDPAWHDVLDRWQVGVLAVSASDQPSLVSLVRADDRWDITFEGEDGLVAVRPR